jgi:hypothetical protein
MVTKSKVGTDLHLGEACLSREQELDEALIEDEEGSCQRQNRRTAAAGVIHQSADQNMEKATNGRVGGRSHVSHRNLHNPTL